MDRLEHNTFIMEILELNECKARWMTLHVHPTLLLQHVPGFLGSCKGVVSITNKEKRRFTPCFSCSLPLRAIKLLQRADDMLCSCIIDTKTLYGSSTLKQIDLILWLSES